MNTINENKIKSIIQFEFDKNKKQIGCSNVVSFIHPQVNIYYNSLNICLGPQGSGKTTFMLFELLKLSQCKDSLIDKVIYIFPKEVNEDDLTFNSLKNYLTFDLLGLSFDDSEEVLSTFFEHKTQTGSNSHTLIVIEDGTYLFENVKKNSLWLTWLIRLRHLKLTVWINVHNWKTINMNIRSQVTNLFIFKGISSITISQIFNQMNLQTEKDRFKKLYNTLCPHQVIRLTSITPLYQNGEYPYFFEHMKKIDLLGNNIENNIVNNEKEETNSMSEDELFNF